MSKSIKIERRFLPFDKSEFRVEKDGESVVLRGYAAVYNSLSADLGEFREIIMPGAFTRTLATKPDVRLLVNHDGIPLARTKSGTLNLSEDSRGLLMNARIDPNSPLGMSVKSALDRGDMDQMSFAFRCLEQSWRKDGDQSIREVRDCEIGDGDVSIVTYPAYSETSVAARDLEAAREAFVEFRNSQKPLVLPGRSVEMAKRLLILSDL